MTVMEMPLFAARTAAAAICAHFQIPQIDLGLVLGSGWATTADVVTNNMQLVGSVSMSSMPHFLPPTAAGHKGEIRICTTPKGQTLAILQGRTHPYEGAELWKTVHGVRTLAAAGAKTVILTNAAGAIDTQFTVGQPVLISDHLNFTGKTPLQGAEFVSMNDAYSPRLRAKLQEQYGLQEGVYAMMPGPQYETPAEIRALRSMGATMVGMSTVYETIALRALEVEVLGISLITNMAAGLSPSPLTHMEVLAAGQQAAQEMGKLLTQSVLL